MREPSANHSGFLVYDAEVRRTKVGTPYLTEPGVALISRPNVHLETIRGFIGGFDDELQFGDYLEDDTILSDGAEVCKFAGQNCYLSLGPTRTKNANAKKYFDNIKSSGHGCYDAETEVLTAEGWKHWDAVTEEDRLATRRVDGVLEYHKPQRLIRYQYKGRMYRVDARGVDLLVTPDHKMLACITTTREGRSRANYQLVSAADLGNKSHAYIKSASWLHGSDDLSEDAARLLGFTVGDGYVAERSRQIRFHLRRERKITWLRGVVLRLGWRMEEDEERDEYKVYPPDDLLDLFQSTYADDRSRCIPQKLLMTQTSCVLTALFEGLMQADGHEGRTGDTFDTTSRVLAGQVQQICLHIGLAANICYEYGPEDRPTSYGDKPLTRLTIIRRELKPEVNKYVGAVGRTSWIDSWEGEVFCAEVPNNTLYVRRCGKPVWSGNSVLEHANYGFLFYGDSRSFTHELVRHRVGVGFSQASQRYIDGTRLRFVERPEYVGDEELHTRFERWIDLCAEEYDWRAETLLKRQKAGDPNLAGLSKTELRKRVNQAARSCLPNETEAPIVVTANARTWRHILEMRASRHAEVEIRRVAFLVYRCLRTAAMELFDDYREIELPDGTVEVQTEWRKV